MPAATDLVFVTNIPTPYRTAFFNVLHEQCLERNLGLHVLFCARTEPRRSWPYSPAENRYPHEILPGWAPTLGDITFPVNLGIRARLAALSPQVVIFGGAWNMPTNLVATAPPKTRARTLFWSEGHGDAALHTRGPIAVARSFALSRYDGFVVPNKRSREWLEAQADADDYYLLPNTVDEDFWRRKDPDERVRARALLGIDADERVVVQVGYLEALKGALELARAFASTEATLRDRSRIVFVGGGSQAEVLTSIGREILDGGTIQVTGDLGRDQVRQWLMAADAFALNTKGDSNPLTPLEACFASLPLLLSVKAGNINELLEISNGVAIQRPEQPDRPLHSFLEMPLDELRSMGEASLRIADSQFTRSLVSRDFLSGLPLRPGGPRQSRDGS